MREYETWRAVLDDLVDRGLHRPAFLIVDGAPGLEKAIVAIWDGVPVQRCTVHKHRNLLAHAPDRLHDESWGMLRRFRPVVTCVDKDASKAAQSLRVAVAPRLLSTPELK